MLQLRRSGPLERQGPRGSLKERVCTIFLPTGYPRSVSHDYTTYHIYNALQVFLSTIAGLFASRAVLQGMGFDDKNASASNAVALAVAQDSMGRLATIVFAHQVGTTIEADCKTYRLLADFLADAAMISDCLSPLLPQAARLPALGASSIFRAMCGIASANSKQTLSSHFARGGHVPVSELNSKDASQETATSLAAMWLGTAIVAWANSTISVWVWLLSLVGLHIWTNYLAIRSVSVHSINRIRANIIFSSLIEHDIALGPGRVAENERIFDRGSTVRWRGARRIGICDMGVTTSQLLRHVGTSTSTRSEKDEAIKDSDFQELMEGEQYLLWVDGQAKHAYILLGLKAVVRDQLKAWSHALWVLWELEKAASRNEADVLSLIKSVKQEHDMKFDAWIARLDAAGWETRTSPLEATQKNRYDFDQYDSKQK